MKLRYKKIGFALSFRDRLAFAVPPEFIFRSVMGCQLRGLCCIARDRQCGDCNCHAECIYGSIFESIVPKDNQAAAGRDRIAHPIIIETAELVEKAADSLTLNIILTGPAINALPYCFKALEQGGKQGVLRDRIPYAITDCFEYSAGGAASILRRDRELNTGLEAEVWEFDAPAALPFQGRILVQLLSPLRFKVRNHYTSGFSAADFAFCLHRRARTLCAQYGSITASESEYRFSGAWRIAESSLAWKDWPRYSARQGGTMRLGGLTGAMTLEGAFTPYEYALLRFAEIFHAGKNTNFGLGKLALWEKIR